MSVSQLRRRVYPDDWLQSKPELELEQSLHQIHREANIKNSSSKRKEVFFSRYPPREFGVLLLQKAKTAGSQLWCDSHPSQDGEIG